MSTIIDPVCLAHGKPWSANPPHWAGSCVYCCLCFKVFNNLEEMHLLPNGMREDVCHECYEEEQKEKERRGL